MILNIIIATVIFLSIVFLLGLLVTYFMGSNQECFALNYMCGMVVFFAVFQLLFLPSVFLRLSFNKAFVFMLLSTALLCVFSAYLNRKRFKKVCFAIIDNIKGINWVWFVSLGILVFSIFFYLTNIFGVDRDDPTYVGTALSILHTNTLSGVNPYTGIPYEGFAWRRVMSPFPHYWAFLSRLLFLHPAIIARTFLPVFLYVFCFCIFYNLGKRLFDGNVQKAASFVLVYQILIVITSTSESAQGFWYLLAIHWGKALVAVAFIPLCIYQYLKLTSPDSRRIDWAFLFAIVLATCLVSSMGISLSAITIGLLGIVHLILKRDIKHVCYMAICCIPNVIFGLLFALNTGGFIIGM